MDVITGATGSVTGTDDGPAVAAPQSGAQPAPPPDATGSALDSYLQFAGTSHAAGTGGAASDAAASPVYDYLAVLGVDPATVAPGSPDLPPSAVLLNTAHATDAGTGADQPAVGNPALAAVPAKVPVPHHDETQHGGV